MAKVEDLAVPSVVLLLEVEGSDNAAGEATIEAEVEATIEAEVEATIEAEIEATNKAEAEAEEIGAKYKSTRSFSAAIVADITELTFMPRRPDHTIPVPNSKVSRIEDALDKELTSRGKAKGDNLQPTNNLPYRPGFGTQGKKVTLWANYFELIPALKLVLYRYHINVDPEVKGMKGEQIIRLLLEMPTLAEFKGDLVTDFKSTLISRKKLPQETLHFDVTYRAEKEDEPSPKAKTYRIQVGFTNTLTVAQLTEFLTSTRLTLGCSEKLPIMQALNIIVRHFAKSNSNLIAIGSSKTFSLSSNSAQKTLGDGLTALRGFFSSVRVATSRILVNVNVSHGAFYQAIRLDDLLLTFKPEDRKNYPKLKKFLSKVRVKLIHLPEKKNKAGEVIPKLRSISGLASMHDGLSLDHPPKVAKFGAGPRDVKFFERSDAPPTGNGGKTGSSKKGAKGGKPSAPSSSAGGYISVEEYFVRSKCAFRCVSI